MSELMAKPAAALEGQPTPDLRNEIQDQIGSIPESLEQPIAWAQDERIELGRIARGDSRRLSTMQARLIATGMALATVAGMSAPKKAEAGDSGRKLGSIISVVGRVGGAVSAGRAERHMERARMGQFELEILQQQAEALVLRHQVVLNTIASLESALESQRYPERIERLKTQLAQATAERDQLFQEAITIDGKIAALEPKVQKELKAGQKAGMWAAIANIASQEGERMRWGY